MAKLIYKVLPKGEPISSDEKVHFAGETYTGDSEVNQQLVNLGYVEIVGLANAPQSPTQTPTPVADSIPTVQSQTIAPSVTPVIQTVTPGTENDDNSRRRGKSQ
jgi:hypothetical protein